MGTYRQINSLRGTKSATNDSIVVTSLPWFGKVVEPACDFSGLGMNPYVV